jgi:hypothetical protein
MSLGAPEPLLVLWRGGDRIAARVVPISGRRTANSVAGVTLFFPRVSVVVVAVPFPEARLVVLAQLYTAYPLGAFPEIQMGHEQSRWAAVLRLERLALVLVGYSRLPAS